METIVDRQGNKFEFEKLKYNEDRLIKVNLSNEEENVDTEGIWATVSDKDYEDHKSNKRDGYFIAMLCNNALSFYPNKSWGLHVVCKHNGVLRPTSIIDWVDYSKYHIYSE